LPLSAIDAITPALNHTRKQLLDPFRFSQWVRLAFVGLFAGETGSFNGFNFGGGSPSTNNGNHPSHFLNPDWWAQFSQHRALLVTLIVVFVLLALCLMFALLYVSSVMRFALFDSVVRKECHVRKSWRERKRIGSRYFLWRIGIAFVELGILAILFGVPALCAWKLGWFDHPSDHLAKFILGIVVFVLLFIFLAAVIAVFEVMTKDFVVPVMALEGVGATEGWRRLVSQIRTEKGGYAAYIGMKIVLAISAAIIFGIITLIAMLILLVPAIAGGVIGILAGKAAGWTWNASTIALAVVLCCIFLAALVFVSCLISVPTVVFFPAYSIYFFAPRYPPLVDLLWPLPPLSTTSASPPTPAPAG
jgi:hypothetical protein